MNRKIFLFLHLRPEKHLALRPCSRMGIRTQAICCRLLSILLMWLSVSKVTMSTPDIVTARVQRPSSQSIWSKSTGEAWWGELLLSRQAASGVEGGTGSSYRLDVQFSVRWGIMPDNSLSHTCFADCAITFWKSRATWFSCDVYILFLSPWVLLHFLILDVLGTWRYLTSLLLPSSCLSLLVAAAVISTLSFCKELFSFNSSFSVLL